MLNKRRKALRAEKAISPTHQTGYIKIYLHAFNDYK